MEQSAARLEARIIAFARARSADPYGRRRLIRVGVLARAVDADPQACIAALQRLERRGELRVLVGSGTRVRLRPWGVDGGVETSSPPALPGPLLCTGQVRCYQRGELIILAETAAEVVYLIRRGYARDFALSEDGDEATLAVLGPGQLVGIAALFGEPTYHAFAEALTELEAQAVPVGHLRECIGRDPQVRDAVLAAIGQRLLQAEGRIQDQHLPVPERLVSTLGRLQAFLGGELPRLTQGQLADLIGARRETVSRALARLEDGGRLRRGAKHPGPGASRGGGAAERSSG